MRATAALLICLGLGLAACKPAAGGGAVTSDDMSLGNPSAKVTVVEYASLGCPICAEWNNTNFAAFKAKYIDTGKVRYVLREQLTGDAPVAAAGFLLARCAGKDKYFEVVDAVWRGEAPLLEHNQNAAERDALVKVAQSAGLTEQQFDACVSNDDSIKSLNDRSDRFQKDNNIQGTPTFVINGHALEAGDTPMPVLDKAIADAQAAAK